ncbi:F-box protein At2g26160-like [Rosa rugosa]|uniref:F-box protein At2g26160-like n=1 Tax=Rosa rugosa TaxID=74645 RepID=UPI002B406614|nr:F-box protein At2g26160-like [Rosa rugosa]
MADWSGLHQDLVICIAKQIVFLKDFHAFGAVCKPWRSAATKDNFTGPSPLLMVSGWDESSTEANIRKLVHLKGRPEIYMNYKKQRCCYYSSLGWLMSISEDFKVSLLNPFDHHARIKLPDINMLKASVGEVKLPRFLHYDRMISKFVLSSCPFSSSDWIVVVSYEMVIGNGWGFCRLGDDKWTHVSWYLLMDLAYYNGQLYAVDIEGNILICDIQDLEQPKTSILLSKGIPMEPIYGGSRQRIYIVESAGVLLVVLHTFAKSSSIKTIKLRVFEVPFDKTEEWEWSNLEVKNLGNKTLFLGCKNSSYSIEASEYYFGCKPNCIYFTIEWLDWVLLNSLPEINVDDVNMEYEKAELLLNGNASVFIFNMEDEKVEQLLAPTDLGLGEGETLWLQPQPPSL